MSAAGPELVALDAAPYRQLLVEHPGLEFASPDWGLVLERGLGFRGEALLFRAAGEVRGAIGLFRRRFGPLRLAYSGLPYGAPIGELPPPHELRAALLAWARRRGVARLRLFEAPGGGFADLGADVTRDVTHLLRLAGTDAERLWSGFRREIRRDVRKAERSGVEVHGATGAEAASLFYPLYLASMERNRALPKYSSDFVRALCARYADGRHGAALFAERQGERIAGLLLVDSRDGAHFLLAGSTTAGLRYLPNDLLIWRALQRSLQLGHRWFDFLPSGPADFALQRFKSKWGAEEVPVATHDLVLRPVAVRLWELVLAAGRLAPVRALARRRAVRRMSGG